MIEPAFQFSRYQHRRKGAIVELCAQKGWRLVALHVRTTHLHIIVGADVAPELILQACKAYATRALKGIQGRVRASAIHYGLDGQGTRMEVYTGDGRPQDPPIS